MLLLCLCHSLCTRVTHWLNTQQQQRQQGQNRIKRRRRLETQHSPPPLLRLLYTAVPPPSLIPARLVRFASHIIYLYVCHPPLKQHEQKEGKKGNPSGCMAAAAGIYRSPLSVSVSLHVWSERASERTTLTPSTLLLAFLARISNKLFFFKRLFSAAAALLVISHHHLPIRISTRSFSSSLPALSSGFRKHF